MNRCYLFLTETAKLISAMIEALLNNNITDKFTQLLQTVQRVSQSIEINPRTFIFIFNVVNYSSTDANGRKYSKY